MLHRTVILVLPIQFFWSLIVNSSTGFWPHGVFGGQTVVTAKGQRIMQHMSDKAGRRLITLELLRIAGDSNQYDVAFSSTSHNPSPNSTTLLGSFSTFLRQQGLAWVDC